MKKLNNILVAFALIINCLSSCTVIQEYDKIFLYDEDMQLAPFATELYEVNFQSYREGSTTAVGGKSGGGCGCY